MIVYFYTTIQKGFESSKSRKKSTVDKIYLTCWLYVMIKLKQFSKMVISGGQNKSHKSGRDNIVLAVDLGGTNLRMAAIDSLGNILYREKKATPKTENADEIVRAIIETASGCRQFLDERNEIKAIAAAVPGTVDINKGTILTAPNVPALNKFRIAEVLKCKLGLPCFLENDANAAAVGENWLGASKGFQDSIFITLGTGVGGGIIIEGRLHRGKNGTAGEIGHICVEPYGINCGCGSRGCIEQYSSATAVVRIANELKEKYPDSKLNENSFFTSLEIYNAAKANDSLAKEVFRRQGFYLGIVLAGLINTLNPEIIVIGGGAAAGWDLFMSHVVEQINSRTYQETAIHAKIVRARLGDDAGLLGAACLAFSSVV
jgi:glucokinase